MNSAPSRPLLPVVALFAVQVIFGFNFAASKVVLEQFPPTLWGAIRLLVSALLLFSFSGVVVPRSQRKIDPVFLRKTFVYGLFGMALSQFFFMYGIKNTTTTNGAIMNALTPLFTLAIAVLAGMERLTRGRVLGFLLAIAGAVVIRDFEEFRLSSATFLGDASMLLNGLSLAAYLVFSQRFLRDHSPYWATAWMFLFGAVVLFTLAAGDLGGVSVSGLDSRFYLAAFYNVVLATLVTYLLNAWALTRVSASMVALFFYFQPVVALLNGWISLGETLTVRTALATGLIFAGLGLGMGLGMGERKT